MIFLFNVHIPVSPLISYNIKFVERATFEERIIHAGQGFTVREGNITSRAPEP
jgi:hypothetical protein